MDRADALIVFGLDSTHTEADLRDAYRRTLRRTHPDVSDSPDAAVETRRITEAYRLLRAYPTVPRPLDRVDAHRIDTVVEDDALLMTAPQDEVFDRLVAACEQVADVIDSDSDAGYLEARVPGIDGRLSPSQLVVTLQGRAHGTEVFFTLEPLDSRWPAADLAGIVRRIAALVNQA